MSVNEELFYTLRRSNACLRRKHDGGSGCHGGSGRILDFLDESVGVSQQQLADKIGKKREYIALIEKGETDMQLSTFIMISEALGLHFALTY